VRAQRLANGVALVIGNSKYLWEAQLPNVRRDAPDIAKRFEEMGLKTALVQDAGRDAMFAAIDRFKAAASDSDLAAFYFAGHGASWDKETYLVPVDSDLNTPEVVKTLIPVRAINGAVQRALHRLLIFDNCRNNPADGWRQRAASDSAIVSAVERAATALYAPNTLILFSTAPGGVALDGPPRQNSPFAAAVLDQLDGASIDLASLAARVRRALLVATEGRQLAWDQSTYTAPFMVTGTRSKKASSSSNPFVDVSRIVELPKTYAFAKEKKLSLPEGLVAIRPRNPSQYGQWIGGFQSEVRTSVGVRIERSQFVEPAAVVILNVTDDGFATNLFSCRQYMADTGVHGDGRAWWLNIGKYVKDELIVAYLPATIGRNAVSVRWADRSSGRLSLIAQGGSATPFTAHINRLD